jgi:hypothetical protein
LVTFNGKSFEAPLMATRYRLARLPFADGGETLAGLCPWGCIGGGRIGSLQLPSGNISPSSKVWKQSNGW